MSDPVIDAFRQVWVTDVACGPKWTADQWWTDSTRGRQRCHDYLTERSSHDELAHLVKRVEDDTVEILDRVRATQAASMYGSRYYRAPWTSGYALPIAAAALERADFDNDFAEAAEVTLDLLVEALSMSSDHTIDVYVPASEMVATMLSVPPTRLGARHERRWWQLADSFVLQTCLLRDRAAPAHANLRAVADRAASSERSPGLSGADLRDRVRAEQLGPRLGHAAGSSSYPTWRTPAEED